MSGLTQAQSDFLASYGEDFAELQHIAASAEEYFHEVVSQGDFDIHLITARAKTPRSVRNKVLEKRYEDPAVQLTDKIGVRIITYYGSDVDRIADHIRPRLNIDRENSVDKRRDLAQSEFGYRSVHIVAKLRGSELRDSRFAPIKGHWIEVQIRSVLDHAWAAIQHEVVYKSGISYPEEVSRRFFAIAGALEVLEQEFLRLRAERDLLVQQYAKEYSQGQGISARLDVARLLALLEVTFPEARGPRKGRSLGSLVDPYTEKAALESLRSVGVTSGRDLLHLVERKRFQKKLDSYAASAGISPKECAHLSIVVLAVGHKDVAVMRSYFPELSDSAEIRGVFG